MSHVTDLVFITPNRQTAELFQDTYERLHGDRPQSRDSGDHCTGVQVFHQGVDYMTSELREWLLAGPESWGCPVGTVMYLRGEDDDEATVIVSDGRKPKGNGVLIGRVEVDVTDQFTDAVESIPALQCAACIQDARNAEAYGQPIPEIHPAATTVGGNSICDVRHRIGTPAQAAAAQASGLLLPGAALPPMNGHRP